MSKCALFLPLLLLAACGGTPAAKTPKPAEADQETPAEKTEAKTDEAPDTGDKPAAEKADSKKSDAKPASDSPKATRSAQDIITAPDVVFMLSFNDSDVKQAAETKCTASSGNDPKKMIGCMSKARKEIDIDGYQFKEISGKWYWLTLRTQGKTLHMLHKFEIEFGPEAEGSVTIKPKGKDLGSKPGRTPGTLTIQVPNDYQIALSDPKLGKLVYEAKIGLLSNDANNPPPR
ncbi:MAG TPA: hypothetical protein VGJ91_04655 [Polyangiaceae bacterium]